MPDGNVCDPGVPQDMGWQQQGGSNCMESSDCHYDCMNYACAGMDATCAWGDLTPEGGQ